MKDKYKIALMFIVSVFSILVGFTNVSAATLTEEKIPNIWYTRRGGGKAYMSAQYTTYNMDGKVVYCIEPGSPINTHNYSGATGWINSPYSAETNRKIQLYGYYGYSYPGHNTIRYRMAAQALIWEETGGQIIEYWTEASGWGDYINVDKEKNEIKALAAEHYKVPSFNNENKNGIIGQPITYTDNTGVLSNYEIYSSPNATSSINGNTLTVIPTSVGDISVSLIRKSYTSDPTQIFVGFDVESQKMGYFAVDDPVVARVSAKVVGGRVEIIKKDADTNSTTPSGQASLVGAVYGVYDGNDNLITKLTTDENSYAISDYLPSLNVHYIKELVAPTGYTLDDTKYYFKLSQDDLLATIELSDKVIERKFDFTKVVASDKTGIMTPEANIGFEIYDINNKLVYSGKTNNDGKLFVVLPYGKYRLHQSTSNVGFERLEDWNFEVKDLGPTINKVFSNAEITARLKVIKIDDSGNVITKSGIKFKIKDLSTGKYICQSVSYPKVATYCEFETSDDGTLITPYPLNSGDYQLEEIDQVIYGYVWNKEPLKFSINEKSNLIKSDEFDAILEVKFENKEVKGIIEIKKTGEKLVIENDTYTYEEIPLPNTVFEVYDENNKLIGTIKTDDSGYGKLENLKLQKYTLKEVSSALDNMVDENEYEIELVYKDQYTPIITKTFTLKNYLPKGTLEFSKTDLSTSEPIPNTLIEIYVADTDELVFSGRTDDQGMIIITDLPTNIELYILEKETADPSYILNEEKMYFSISENGEVVKANMENEKKKGTLEFSKIDLSTSAPIPNTLIEIYNADTDELVFSGRTDDQGMIVIELEYGRYFILEKETADPSYKLNEEKMYFEILENGEVIKATMTNEKIEMPKTFNTDLSSTIMIAITALLGIGLLVYEKKKNK